jgi:hypothetical protein
MNNTQSGILLNRQDASVQPSIVLAIRGKETPASAYRDTFWAKESFMSAKSHFWRKRDIFVGKETHLEENKHLCWRRDTFGGK